jgi:DNA-binding Lrp family transcriptional regulator
MSYKALAWAASQKTRTTGAFAVLVALASFCNAADLECWPSQNAIAEKTSLSQRSVRDQIKALIDDGLLKKCMVSGRQGYSLLAKENRQSLPQDRNSLPVEQEQEAEVIAAKPEVISPTAEVTSGPTELREETRRERNRKPLKKDIDRPDDVSENIWADFIVLRKVKNAPVTETVLRNIRLEAQKAGWSIEKALETMCARGWQGFNSEWVKTKDAKNGNSKSQRLNRALDEAVAELGYAAMDGTIALPDPAKLRDF